MSLRVLILGGYGTFGGRLARLLADEARLTLIIAGRSLRRAQAFCAAAFDRERDDGLLAALAPDIVVDASGPFQTYGDPYRVVRAALARGIDYLDLADGSDFVHGIAQFDGEARSRGVFVLAGASSFPVLTAAVVRRLAAGMTIDAVSAGIAPSPHAGLGLNVIRAIASYCGKPIALPLLCERFGTITVGMALLVEGGRLRLIVRRWSAFGIPLPLRLAPRGDADEYAENGRFHFQVEIGHPITGPIVGYRGWLVPK